MQNTDNEKVKCIECEKEYGPDEIVRHAGEDYCEDCYNDTFVECADCGDVIARDDAWTYSDDELCRSCYRDRENQREDDEGHSDLGEYERHWSGRDLPDFQDGARGEIINSRRVFSAEIECYDREDNIASIAGNLHDAIGISEDGSLEAYGVEFQTPKLKGGKGERAVVELCRVLNENGCTTDRTTGLHIHLDGKDLIPARRTRGNADALRTLLTVYLAYEDVMLSFLPPSRRGNRFCSMLRHKHHTGELEGVYTLEAFERLWYRVNTRRALVRCKSEKYENSRYTGVNFHSLLKDGHLEIRYHSGTTNARKILEWTNLHQRIMDWAGEHPGAGYVPLEAMQITDLKEKTLHLYKILRLPETSRQYFNERQALFASSRGDKDESESVSALNEPLQCAA